MEIFKKIKIALINFIEHKDRFNGLNNYLLSLGIVINLA